MRVVGAKFTSLRFRLTAKTALRSFAPPLQFANAALVCKLSGTRDTHSSCTLKTEQCEYSFFQAACISCRSSPRAISTGQLHTLLHFHLRPINDVVYIEPYSIKDERSNLRESFTLRCFQRLSRPYVATQLCRWHDNWCTRGMSIPVLSY